MAYARTVCRYVDCTPMGKTLVTGGAGFLGSHIIPLLLKRGDEVRVTVREGTRRDNLEGMDVEYVRADILDRRALRRALQGVDRVFHIAGLSSLRASADILFRVNVRGARNIFEESLAAGVERVVYTSSVAAVGPPDRGKVADETQDFRIGGYGIPYIHAKRGGEVEALRMCARGLPVTIVNPGFALGAGDINHTTTELVRRFMRREIPAYVDGALNIVDVRDVARGHILADERGEIGERYILGGRNFTLDRLFSDLGRLSGVEPPSLKLPMHLALVFAAAAEQLPGRPLLTTTEVRSGSLWWAFSSAKAKRELGWKPLPHDETLERTIAWYRENEPEVSKPGSRQPIPLRLAGTALRYNPLSRLTEALG